MGLVRPLVADWGRLQSAPTARAAVPSVQPRKRRRAEFGAHKRLLSASGTAFPIAIDDPGMEFNSALVGANWYGSPDVPGIAIEMMRDTHMRAAYALGTNPIRTGKWVVESGGDDPESKKCAAALEWNLFRVLNWDAFLEKLMYAHRDGFSLHETLADFIEFPSEFAPSGMGGLGFAYTGFEHIPAWTVSQFQPAQKNNRQLESVRLYSGSDFASEVEIPIKWIFRYTMAQEGSEFRGFPTNRSCYGPWFLKMGYQTINSIKQDRFGVGIPYAIQPSPADGIEVTEDDIASVNYALSEIRVNERAYFNLPPGWQVQLLSFDTDQDTDLLQSIEFCNRDIFLCWGAGFASMGDTKFGSFALGKVHDKHHYLNNRAFSNSLTEALNKGCDGWGLSSRFRDANFPNAQLPKIRIKVMQSRDWLADLTELDKFVANGTIPQYDALSEHVADVLEAPVPDVPFSELIENARRQTANEAPSEDEE